jgi:hypothetical protein
MPGRAFVAGLLLLGTLLAATGLATRPPPPAPADAPAGSFSAARALPRLWRVLEAAGPGAPHPAGSPAGDRVRAALAAELRALGLDPRIHSSWTCNRYLTCTPVANLVARIPGRGPGPAVLVSAHHDSVPAGPGAADDGSGLAVALELAHALRAGPAAADVLLLLDDAEESGLGGAEAFLRSPEAREVGAVVNLEARGTGGPSLLFEATGAEARVAAAAATLRRPLGSSLFSTVYGMIPNDTDLTVLRALGIPGANLAFIEGAVRYHTPRDDRSHLDPASVQHHGENALSLVRALAVPGGDAGGAVWFDVLGRVVVRFPRPWALPLALLALGLAGGGAFRDVRRGRARAGGVVAGLLALPLGAGSAAALGLAAASATGLHPLFRPWVASPGPLVAAFLLSGLAGAAMAPLLLGRAGHAGLRSGLRLALSAGAVALAVALPGASYLLLVPALAGGLVAAVAGRDEAGGAAADLVTLVAGALVLLPPAWMLYPGLGHAAGPAAALAVAVAALPLAPLAAPLSLRARALSTALPVAAGLASLSVALLLPVADEDAPERVVVYFHQDADTGTARVLANADLGRLPPAMRAAAPFSAEAAVRLPWGAIRPAFAADAPPLDGPAPQAEVLESSRRGDRLHWRARLTSPRGAGEIQLAVPPTAALRSLTVEGEAMPPAVPKLARWFGGWAVHRFLVGPRGVEVDLTAESAGPLEMVLADWSPDLPPAAARVVAARPPSAVTQQEGDGTLVTRRLRVDP